MNDSRIRNRMASLAELAANAPYFYEALNRVGLQRRRSRAARAAREIGWFGAGIAVGSGLTTLLTPRTGREMRRRLSDRAHQVREYVAPKRTDGSGSEAGSRASSSHREGL